MLTVETLDYRGGMVRYGLSLPNGGECGDPRFVLELAERGEAAGWEGLFMEDYVSYQGDPHAPTCDVWTTLGAIAVRTRRIILGTAVTPLPRRRPWNVAREAAAIDQLSEGRFVLGVGIGDAGEHVVADASLTHFGEVRDRRQRAERLDEGAGHHRRPVARRAIPLLGHALPDRRGHLPAAPGAAAAHPDLG